MTTYVYETIPTKPGEEVRYFENRQSMTDSAFTRHPGTGEPIRRVFLGGYGLAKKGSDAPSAGGVLRKQRLLRLSLRREQTLWI